jgi:hypothetical protein
MLFIFSRCREPCARECFCANVMCANVMCTTQTRQSKRGGGSHRGGDHSESSPQSLITKSPEGTHPSCWPCAALFISKNTKKPWITCPKATLVPSLVGSAHSMTMNWDVLLLGAWLAIETTPGWWCLRAKDSSLNTPTSEGSAGSAKMDLPPNPSLVVMSPPWHAWLGYTRWNADPL